MNDFEHQETDLPPELRSLVGVFLAAGIGGLLLTGFSLLTILPSRTMGATASGRIERIEAKLEAGQPLTDGERLLLEERIDDERPQETP